ncbi:MAG: TraR/DksA family transcriptional regulator [Proteobacteria bacterium]|nr:TraR/DksA family transcriptional regulator [Pseudomonadota bacterium]NIS72763.1 TraR/DksA family transcriptional regulator [Pseudomonadota bacterium]
MKQGRINRRDIGKLKEILLDKREEIIGGVKQIHASSQEMGQDGIQDMADEASNLYTKQILMSLSENQRQVLREIDEALDRITEGTYGTCDGCGDPINLKRLQIRPFAKYCVQCQDSIERQTSDTSIE